MPTVHFINRFYSPDQSATAQMLADLVSGLKGLDIHVITSRQHYGEAGANLPKSEQLDSVQVNRIWTTRFGRKQMLGRALDYLSFYFSVFVFALRKIKRGDYVVVMTDPPLLNIPIGLCSRLKKARQINWLQDLFPEIAYQVSGQSMFQWLSGLPRWLRNRQLCRSQLNVVISDAMAGRLKDEGVPESRIRVIHNWSDDQAIMPLDKSENPLLERWNIQDRFVVLYSGNMGRVHDFAAVTDACLRLRSQEHIKFIFIGEGYHRAGLEQFCRDHELGNMVFMGYQDRQMLRYSLGLGDIHIVSQLPSVEGLVFPSKFFGVLAAGRCVAFIGDPEGEIATLLKNSKSGFSVALNQGQKLANLILEYASDQRKTVEAGMNARSLLEREFSYDQAMEHWQGIFQGLE